MNKSQHRSIFSGSINVLRTRPVFLFLLPVFFVLHGVIDHFGSVPLIDALWLTIMYIAISIGIAGIGCISYRNLLKASFLSLFIVAFQCYFGVVQDALSSVSPKSILSQYRFIIPVSCLIFLGVVIWLKKRKRTLFLATSYINTLLLILILIDAGTIAVKANGSDRHSGPGPGNENYVICDTCKKPDIYFILLDQYAGNEALKSEFNFDNNPFIKQLTTRGFGVAARSRSNYNVTPYSLASTLNMNYVELKRDKTNHLDLAHSYEIIRTNFVLNFLNAHGYQFHNLSVFNFPGQPAHKYVAFLPYGTEFITSQTFTSRIHKAIRADVVSGKINWPSYRKKLAYQHLKFNDDIYSLVEAAASSRSTKPKFVYAHFMMPHFPYYYDKEGKPMPFIKVIQFTPTSRHDYIEYLQYCNKKVLELVDYIFSASGDPPVIILLGDHGFRDPNDRKEINYEFSNLNAVYLPGKNCEQFSDDMTNVNLFRVFFNTSFNQRFPLLKDTTINFWE